MFILRSNSIFFRLCRFFSISSVFSSVACEKCLHQIKFIDHVYYSDAMRYNRACLGFEHLFEQDLDCSCVCRERLSSHREKQSSRSDYVKSD